MAGDDRSGAAGGPATVIAAGAVELFERHGLDVGLTSVERPGPFRDTASSSAAVNVELAAAVAGAVRGGRLPVVLAGSCVAAHGVLAAFDHARTGVIWIDAHADFNTPESSVSGFLPGMTLAVVAGHTFHEYWGAIGDNTPVEEDSILMLGLRELSPQAEGERLDRSAIAAIRWHDGHAEGDVDGAIERLAARVDDVYLHIDLDAFDPSVAPGIVDAPVAGGLALEDAERILHAVFACGRPVRAATIATFNPERDRGRATLGVVLRLLDLVAGYARSTSPR
jgi:arginase